MNETCVTAAKRPFLVTIDTEGDNLWAKTSNPGTENARYLPRFQALCERYGLKPVYLIDHRMANCETLQEFVREVLRRSACEVGMHLHAWDTPSDSSSATFDKGGHPYLINFSDHAMRAKIAFMTAELENVFGIRPVSHRAGRWALNATYVRFLAEFGYKVDCSVTPHVRWAALPSHDGTRRGADYRGFPETAYIMDEEHIDRPGDTGVLQVPMTVAPAWDRWDDGLRALLAPLTEKIGRFGQRTAWLRPTGGNLPGMLGLLERAEARGHDYVEFMLHSSEFMPGGSPTFRDERSIEKLYSDMEQLFATAQVRGYVGCTLADYHAHWMTRSSASDKKHG